MQMNLVFVYICKYILSVFICIFTSIFYWCLHLARKKNANIRSLLFKGKRKTKQWEHLDVTEATVKVTYCGVPVATQLSLTRSQEQSDFCPPWGMRRSLCSLFVRSKKKKYNRKDAQWKGQSEMFLTSTLYGSPAKVWKLLSLLLPLFPSGTMKVT